MPMRATTVRFADDLWKLLEREADRQGVSGAQFVRDATILRLAFLAAERDDDEARLSIESIASGTLGERKTETGNGTGSAIAAALAAPARVKALRASGLLDAPAYEDLDRMARIAARLADAPVGLISLVDVEHQLFAGCVGMAEPWASDRQSPLTHSFCQHAVAAREPLIVPDAREHPTLRSNLAIRDMGVIAYAGVPLKGADEQVLGTVCVIDHVPRSWRPEQVAMLEDVAASLSRHLARGWSS
jgi:GAF domain-containing protein